MLQEPIRSSTRKRSQVQEPRLSDPAELARLLKPLYARLQTIDALIQAFEEYEQAKPERLS